MADYIKFYGFLEDPFDISPDPKFFFPSEGHNEALASLLYGINSKKGFILILGEDGIGKTTLIHHLLSRLDEKVTTLLFPRSDLPFQQILKEMLLRLHLPLGLETKGSMIHELYHHLIHSLELDETVTVIIDEAENIGLDVIEEVRLLANLETSTSKLLQIVLVGQQGLREKLRSDIIRQIKQRIVISCEINPLTEEESMRYIDHRLKIVGSRSSEVFSDEALSLICRYAEGVPLAINTFCHNALSVAFFRSEKKVSPDTVKKIRNETGIMTAENARILASGFKRSLPHKIAYVLPVLVILATALFVGRSYWQPLFHAQEPKETVILRVIEEQAKEAIPEVQTQDATAKISDIPDSGSLTAAPETPHTPASPPATANRSHVEGHVKEIIEVKQGATLYSIAYRYYKMADETFIDHILQFNPEITNPNLILVNQKIKIPEMTESSLIVRNSERVYKVHMRTFRNQKIADQYRRDAASMGKEIEIVPWKVSREETWYRVMVGPFATQEDGLIFIKGMKKRGGKTTPPKTE
jgi:type II secretory pathway predicted ATPase ExeA